MDATHLLLEIIYSQTRKEINIPIMLNIFTQFVLYDLMWDMVMCVAIWSDVRYGNVCGKIN